MIMRYREVILPEFNFDKIVIDNLLVENGDLRATICLRVT